MEHIVIIGNGISGITAARHIRKFSSHKITVISAESEHFYSRTALMYVYMGHMRWRDLKPYEDWFWKKNRINLKQAYVSKVLPKNKEIEFSTGELMTYDKLVLATGSSTQTFGWKGQDLDGVQGMVNKQDLELLEENTQNIQNAVIIGGGLIGVELAEMLHTRNIGVTILVREKGFWANALPIEEAKLISKHIASHPGVDIRHETEIDEIIPDDQNRVKAVTTKAGDEIDCQLVGIATGVKPSIGFLDGSGIETDKGVLVNRKLETNIPGIYAIGDCAQQREAIGNRKPIEAVWYTGRMMGETLAQTLCGNPREYKPGNWFNSAKFFEIEYQTYGWVWPENQNGQEDFYWEAPDGEKAMHFNFETGSRKFLGINTFGIRLRHAVIDRWLSENQTIDAVVENLAKANFDPEFYKKYEKDIKRAFKTSKVSEISEV